MSEATAQAFSAAVGGIASTVLLFPLDTIKTRIQVAAKSTRIDRNEQPLTSLATARSILNEGGVSALFYGVAPGAFQSGLEKAMYFYAYTLLGRAHAANIAPKPNTAASLAIGYLAEWCHLPFTLPFERVTKAMQTQKSLPEQRRETDTTSSCGAGTASNPENCTAGEEANGRNEKQLDNAPPPGAVKTMAQIWNEQGLSGYYRGVSAYLVLCFKPAIQYAVYEQLKALLLLKNARKQKGNAPVFLSALEAFVLGALARAVATLVVYPYIKAKVLAQATTTTTTTTTATASSAVEAGPACTLSASSASSSASISVSPTPTPPTESPSAVVLRILADEGVGGVYRGIAPELVRGMLSAALMLMIKERVHGFSQRVVLGARHPSASSSSRA